MNKFCRKIHRSYGCPQTPLSAAESPSLLFHSQHWLHAEREGIVHVEWLGITEECK